MQDRIALVVGIDEYPSAPLEGSINDARAVARVLENHDDGMPNFEVKLCVSPQRAITKVYLRTQIKQLFASDSNVALLYFAGHGLIDSTGGYIVAVDGTREDPGVSMDEILVLANRSKQKNRVVILDCCHSGTFGSPALADGKLTQIGEGVTVLTASRDNEPAREVNGLGVFTSLLVDALEGGAADLLGHVTPGSVYAYVDQALGQWGQRPIFKTNITRFISLREVQPPVKWSTLSKLPEYFPAPTDEFKLGPEYEFTSDVADKKKVPILQDLQKFVSVGLVVPVGEQFMYFAAMNRKSCRLTALGYHYWRLAEEGKLGVSQATAAEA